MTKKQVEIFRAGTHTAQDGTRHTFTADQVRQLVEGYDPILFSAPAVVGHPKHDDPAYGWAAGLTLRDDGVVVADLDKVDPAFADLVEAGRFGKISVSLYAPDQPNNPQPGQHYLRHIGFLGAAAPGVTGLAPVAFAEGDDAYLTFSSDEALRPVIWLARVVGRLFRRQRELLIEEKGMEEADRVLPSWDTDAPAEIAAELQSILDDDGPRFSEADRVEGEATGAGAGDPDPDPLAGREAELAAREAALADREAALAAGDAAAAARRRTEALAEDAAFMDGLVSEGRLPPGVAPQMLGFCEALYDSGPIAFSEGGQAEDPRAALKALLAGSLGTVIRFDEIAPAEGAQFAAGRTADELAVAARERVVAANARGETLSVSSAMADITAGR